MLYLNASNMYTISCGTNWVDKNICVCVYVHACETKF